MGREFTRVGDEGGGGYYQREVAMICGMMLICLWPAIFLLTLRDSRLKPTLIRRRVVHLPIIGEPNLPRRARDMRWWAAWMVTVIASIALLLVFWPGIVGAWVGRRRER